jgi:hypothetical protein
LVSIDDAEFAQVQAYIATDTGSEVKKWLLHVGVDETDSSSIILRFLKPECGVKSLRSVFALDDEDIEPLPLALRKVTKKAIIQEQRVSKLCWGFCTNSKSEMA